MLKHSFRDSSSYFVKNQLGRLVSLYTKTQFQRLVSLLGKKELGRLVSQGYGDSIGKGQDSGFWMHLVLLSGLVNIP